MNPPLLPARSQADPSAWDQALYTLLVQKGNRPGSKRTVESYCRNEAGEKVWDSDH